MEIETKLTKRELIAAQIDVSKDLENWSTGFLEKLVGRSIPRDNIENYKWWAEAEAKLRVMKADALLAELSKS